MNPGQTFAAAYEVEECLPARGRRRRVAGIVQERPGRACQEHRVVLLEVLGRDVRRVIRDRRRPRAGLRSQSLDRFCGERNRRVDEPGRVRLDQHFARPHWPRRCSCGQRRHHRFDGNRLRGLRLRAASAHVERRGQPGRRHCRVERGRELVAGDGAGFGLVGRGEPLASRGFQFLAGDDSIFVGVSREEHERGRKECLQGCARAERRSATALLSRDVDPGCGNQRRCACGGEHRVDQSLGFHVPSPGSCPTSE